jgi:DNA-directed RNA polymerase subunit RPC12/RpoP
MRAGFCAQYHKQDYKCANCGHCETKTQVTNFYECEIVEWCDAVCKECGFKSLKPLPIDLGNFKLSKEDAESLVESLK